MSGMVVKLSLKSFLISIGRRNSALLVFPSWLIVQHSRVQYSEEQDSALCDWGCTRTLNGLSNPQQPTSPLSSFSHIGKNSSHLMKWLFLINTSLPSAGGSLFGVPGHRHTGSRPGYKDGQWHGWHRPRPHWPDWWIHSTRRWEAPLSQHAPTNTVASKVNYCAFSPTWPTHQPYLPARDETWDTGCLHQSCTPGQILSEGLGCAGLERPLVSKLVDNPGTLPGTKGRSQNFRVFTVTRKSNPYHHGWRPLSYLLWALPFLESL